MWLTVTVVNEGLGWDSLLKDVIILVVTVSVKGSHPKFKFFIQMVLWLTEYQDPLTLNLTVLATTSVDLHYSWLFVEPGHDLSMLFHLRHGSWICLGFLVQVIVCVCATCLKNLL